MNSTGHFIKIGQYNCDPQVHGHRVIEASITNLWTVDDVDGLLALNLKSNSCWLHFLISLYAIYMYDVRTVLKVEQ